MNKAFVREEESDVRHCPRCGSLGRPVGDSTLNHWLTDDSRDELGNRALFCPLASCPVAYFDQFERMIDVAQLQRPVWPKSMEAPLCACFGLTADDVDADIDEGGVTRVRNIVEQAKTSAARCQTLAADGQCCVAEVQRYYFKRRGAAES
ncbi:MAG: hypothetical protein ACYTGL_23245 [Planctomycetota bacterium]|jgi:hypothetical protein